MEALEDEHTRALALLKLRYVREVEEAREAGEDIALIEKAREQEIANLHSKYLADRAEEEKKAEEEKANYMRGIEESIAAEKIGLTKKGLDKELALLALEKKKAIREALAMGFGQIQFGGTVVPEIERLFSLREQALRAAQQKPETMVRGTFQATAIWGLGIGDKTDRMLRAAERTARNTELLRVGPVFG